MRQDQEHLFLLQYGEPVEQDEETVHPHQQGMDAVHERNVKLQRIHKILSQTEFRFKEYQNSGGYAEGFVTMSDRMNFRTTTYVGNTVDTSAS